MAEVLLQARRAATDNCWFNPSDLTNVWSHKDYPLIEMGDFSSRRSSPQVLLQSLRSSLSRRYCAVPNQRFHSNRGRVLSTTYGCHPNTAKLQVFSSLELRLTTYVKTDVFPNASGHTASESFLAHPFLAFGDEMQSFHRQIYFVNLNHVYLIRA